MALIALTDTLPTLLGGVFVVLAVIVLFSIVKAYTDTIARRMSSHRIVLNPRPHEDPGGMGVVYLLIGALLLAAWLMDGR
jgi:Zn-dependent protease